MTIAPTKPKNVMKSEVIQRGQRFAMATKAFFSKVFSTEV